MGRFSFRRLFIFAALTAAGGCFWYGMAIVMPDLIYGKIALPLVPPFLLMALFFAVQEFGGASTARGKRKLIAGLLMAAGIMLFISGLVFFKNPIWGEEDDKAAAE